MKKQEALDQVMAEREAEGTATEQLGPARAPVAFVIQFSRGPRVRQAQTLADFVSVSLPSAERAEQVEAISGASLDRVATTPG